MKLSLSWVGDYAIGAVSLCLFFFGGCTTEPAQVTVRERAPQEIDQGPSSKIEAQGTTQSAESAPLEPVYLAPFLEPEAALESLPKGPWLRALEWAQEKLMTASGTELTTAKAARWSTDPPLPAGHQRPSFMIEESLPLPLDAQHGIRNFLTLSCQSCHQGPTLATPDRAPTAPQEAAERSETGERDLGARSADAPLIPNRDAKTESRRDAGTPTTPPPSGGGREREVKPPQRALAALGGELSAESLLRCPLIRRDPPQFEVIRQRAAAQAGSTEGEARGWWYALHRAPLKERETRSLLALLQLINQRTSAPRPVEPNSADTEESGEPAGVAEEPTGVAEEPTGVAEEPTGVAEEPTGVAEEPVRASPSETKKRPK